MEVMAGVRALSEGECEKLMEGVRQGAAAMLEAGDVVGSAQLLSEADPNQLAIIEAMAQFQQAGLMGDVLVLQVAVPLPPGMLEGMTPGRLRLLRDPSEALKPLFENLVEPPALRLVVKRSGLSKAALKMLEDEDGPEEA